MSIKSGEAPSATRLKREVWWFIAAALASSPVRRAYCSRPAPIRFKWSPRGLGLPVSMRLLAMLIEKILNANG